MDKPRVICTTLLIERSPQALPLGAACIASALKHNPLTAGICEVSLISFCAEDAAYREHAATPEEAGAFIADALLRACSASSDNKASSAFKADAPAGCTSRPDVASKADAPSTADCTSRPENAFKADAPAGCTSRPDVASKADAPSTADCTSRPENAFKAAGANQASSAFKAPRAPAVVAFSVFVWNRPVLEAAARILRSRGIICIAGGPEVTAAPESFDCFDYTISGEGELTVPPLVHSLLTGADALHAAGASSTTRPDDAHKAAGTNQASSSFKADAPSTDGCTSRPEDAFKAAGAQALEADKVSSTSSPGDAFKAAGAHIPRSACMDLSALSSPYLDSTLDPADYDGALWELARGCPFKCSYCYESKGEKTVRTFPMERIEAELDLFAEKKVPQVFVLDPTYNANRDRALKLLDLIAKKTPDTFYYFEARAEFIDAKLAKAFTKIPCALQIGLQSADENVLKLVNRPFNRKQFTRNISILNEAGVTFGLDLIYGLPSETYKGFKAGVDFAISQYPNNLEIFCLSVLPGTDLSERAEALKLTYEKAPPYHIIHTDKMSEADIEKARTLAAACSTFYNDGCAVPWFNIVLDTLKMRASDFFEQFASWRAGALKAHDASSADSAHGSGRVGALKGDDALSDTRHKNASKAPEAQESACGALTQREVEQLQVSFVTKLLKEKHLERFIRIVTDLIRFNGAIARNTATGEHEKVHLSYPAEYLESEWMFNLDYFVKEVKPAADTVVI